MESIDFGELSVFLTDGLYPESFRGKGRALVNKRYHYKKRAVLFTFKDGDLYKTVSGSLKTVRVVREGATEAIMNEFHSSNIGGHSGFNKTYSAIKSRYWWPRMSEEIRNYVKVCVQCQKSDPMKPAKKPELQPIHVSRPFELVGCDLMGPFQETESGYKYIFTATDYYTKWVEAFPIQTKSARDVSSCLKKLLYRHGAMNAILTDQGREFLNGINKELCDEWGIGHRVTAAYHPQTNGLDERTNQTIKRALSKCVNDGQTDWDIRLDQVLFSLRTKPQASTKYSPFFLLYGREAQYPSQLPASFGLDHQFPSCPSEDVIDEHIEEREQQQAKTHENVENNTKKAKEKQQKDFKKANEKKRTYVGIKVGDKVLKFNSARATRKSKADLATNYSGPYIVNEIVGQRCRIQSLDGKVLKSLVSLSNVKLFREPSQNPDIEEAGSSDLNECIKILAEEGTFEQVINECMKITKTSGCRPENLGDFAMRVSSCPVMSFVNEVLKTSEAFVDKVRDEILKVRTVREEGDFAGVLMLTSCVMAKAVVEKMSPMDVLETLEDTPVFLAKCEAAKELDNNERLTVAGEGIEKVDLNTLINNNWLNDKVLNGYTKLLARESTDSMDFSSNNNRIFMIPSYTARLWDAGTYDNYLFKRVDFSLYNMIVVPWNINGNHWVVLVARTKESSVMVYDSLGGENSHLIDKFCLFMKKRSEELGQDVINWYKESPTTNQQSDGSSCGVFVLMTVECLVKGRTSWILRQAHVTMFRKYIANRLLLKGLRNTLLCDSLNCKDPKGDLDWVMCDVCYRWLHKTCLIKEFMEEDHFQCGICDAQYF